MILRAVSLLALAAVFFASPACARDYYYFNKSNVSRDGYVADKLECDRLTGGVANKGTPIFVATGGGFSPGQNAAIAGAATLFAGLILGGEDKKTKRAVERTCMADKGYGRYKVEKAFVSEIDKLKTDDERIDRYFALAAMATPVGERIKE
jgi:hypothetical protein